MQELEKISEDKTEMQDWKKAYLGDLTGGNSMSEIKSKPCPFCGGDAEMFMLDDRYTARCRSCFCGTGEYKDPERASETWNRRAGDATD